MKKHGPEDSRELRIKDQNPNQRATKVMLLTVDEHRLVSSLDLLGKGFIRVKHVHMIFSVVTD